MSWKRHYTTPEKPEKSCDWRDQVWNALFNEIPHRLEWQDIKINFILLFMAILLGGMATVIALVAKVVA